MGPPRRPDRVLVSDQDESDALRTALAAEGIEVRVAPTPGLDRLVEKFVKSRVPQGQTLPDVGYLDHGVSVREAEAFFVAADAMFQEQPWESLSENDVLRVSCERLGLDDACVSILGAMGQSHSMLLFPSTVEHQTFYDAMAVLENATRPDYGTTIVSLNFEHVGDLPPRMRKQAAKFGWPVSGTDAYPWLMIRARDSTLLPTRSPDIQLMTACASAVAAYCRSGEATTGSPNSIDVGEFTLEVDIPSRSETSQIHELDRLMVERVLTFAFERFPDAMHKALARVVVEDEDPRALSFTWAAYELEIEEKSLAQWFAGETDDLPGPQRAWLAAQHDSWLSLWQVTSIGDGDAEVVDLLTGAEAYVLDKGLAESVSAHSVLLGRVVEVLGHSLLCGAHPSVLSPSAADGVAQKMRRRLRRKGHIPVERLKGTKITTALIRDWQAAVAEGFARGTPRVQNTDGDPVLLTTDRFAFESMDAVRSGLESIEGIEANDDGSFSLLRTGNAMQPNWDNTLIAGIEVHSSELRVHTNSIRRANELRATLERALGERLTFVARSHTDPTSGPALASARAGTPVAESLPPEIIALVQDHKQKHYEAWVDHPLPALAGKTPRDAVKTAEGRRQVDVLLRELEHLEATLPEAQRYDVGMLRKGLGV